MRGTRPWGQVLGTDCGSVESRSHHGEATKSPFAGLFGSPLTDSNRRPPPYHGGLGAVLASTVGHRRARFACKLASRPVPMMSAFARACSTCCTRLVPAFC